MSGEGNIYLERAAWAACGICPTCRNATLDCERVVLTRDGTSAVFEGFEYRCTRDCTYSKRIGDLSIESAAEYVLDPEIEFDVTPLPATR